MRRTRWMWLVLALQSCEAQEQSSAADESSSTGSDDDVDDDCVDAPVTTWANFGQSFLITNCNACHAAGATDRHGAPAEAVFDRLEDAQVWRARLLARAASDPPTMPPGGGTSEEDRELLRIWLTCDDAR